MKLLNLILSALLILTAIAPRVTARTPLPADLHICLPDDDHPAPLTPCPKPPK